MSCGFSLSKKSGIREFRTSWGLRGALCHPGSSELVLLPLALGSLKKEGPFLLAGVGLPFGQGSRTLCFIPISCQFYLLDSSHRVFLIIIIEKYSLKHLLNIRQWAMCFI